MESDFKLPPTTAEDRRRALTSNQENGAIDALQARLFADALASLRGLEKKRKAHPSVAD